jgi:DNA replication initiation complex subunit (GINS family)
VPVEVGDTCAFCQSYVPPETPAQRLDVAVNRVDLVRHDVNVVLQVLPTDAPLFAVADIVAALGHLRNASVLLDKAADALEADAEAVIR